MKLLLLCLGLTLAWAHKKGIDDVKKNLDLSKISGEWYSILLAADDMEKIEKNGGFRIFVDYIQALGSSSMLLHYQQKKNGQCIEFSLVGDETSQPGVYSAAFKGHNIFYVIEIVYDEYCFLRTVNFNNKKKFQVMELYAREPDVSPEIKSRFAELCQKYGIPEENILDLTKADRCLSTRGSA